MKRLLLVVVAVLGLLFALVGSVVAQLFVGLVEAVDGPVVPGVQLVRDGYVNVYFIDTGDGVALIDCGNDVEATAIIAALSARGLSPASVKAIFLTHGHPDHTAGCRKFPTAQVFAFAAERDIIEGRATSRGPIPKLAGVEPAKTATVTTLLDEGRPVTIGTAEVTAWNVKGHTDGSAVYLAKGVLFLGDSASAEADGDLRDAPWVVSDDVATCKASLIALQAKVPREATHLAFSHSGPFSTTKPFFDYGR